jgi:hypothetical protein
LLDFVVVLHCYYGLTSYEAKNNNGEAEVGMDGDGGERD